jgi:pyrimidine-specific ribonucleoside hydrolase
MKKIFIDTDCGMDDIIAINMLTSTKGVLIEGVTTTRGLTNPNMGKANLDTIYNFLGKKINVLAGSRYPLKKIRLKNKFPEYDVVNSTELEFLTDLIGGNKKTERNLDKFDEFIYQAVSGDKGKTTILCLGPLTNLARVIKKYKNKFTSKIDKLVIMGGAVFSPGNVMPSRKAEYNFFLDPEAANVVLQSDISIVLVSMDATKFVPATKYIKDKISKENPKTKTGKLIQRIIVSNKKDFRFFYDPLAASILLDPKIILDTKQVGLRVSGQGQSLITEKRDNISVITKVDKNRFYKLLFRKIE